MVVWVEEEMKYMWRREGGGGDGEGKVRSAFDEDFGCK
jgi:hypothetical protein